MTTPTTLDTNTTVGIIGAGAMGSGIAQVALTRGHRVLLTDARPPALVQARDVMVQQLRREVEKGRLSADAASNALECLRIIEPVDRYTAFATCGLVIEAIVEDLGTKRATFEEVERVVEPSCVLATNTSSLSIASIANACERPERVLGLHFFNPAPVMPLVEVIAGVRTDPEVVSQARALVDAWGKTPVLAADTPGFIVNRIARPFYGESLRILEEGLADAPTIDWAMREIGGFRMGPFLLMDFIGHDVNYAVTESFWTAMYYDPRYRPSITQRRLVEAGWLGRKSGRGFYDYHTDAPPRPATEDRALGVAIVHRVVCMLVNEAVDAVMLRVATPEAIELAMTKGVNYPKGLLSWGEDIGLDRVLAEIERLRDESGESRYRPSPLLRRMVREGRRFFA